MLTIVLAAIAACLVIPYVYRLSRNVWLGWCSLLAANLFNYTFGQDQSTVGGLHLAPTDAVLLCLLAAGVLRTLPRLKERNTPGLMGLGYLTLFTFSYVRGVLLHGFPAASNEARAYVGVLIAFLYFLTARVDEESVRKYVRLYVWYCMGLVLVALLAYSGLSVGALAWSHGKGEEAINGRLLPASAAAALAISFSFSLVLSGHRRRGLPPKFLALAFFALAVYLRHRTVWMMLATILTVLLFVDGRVVRRFVPSLLALCVLLVGVILLVPREVAEDQSAQISEASTNSGTFLWRLDSWQGLVLDEEQTPFTVLLGKEMGSGFWRFAPATGVYQNEPPHNEYVTQYLRIGVLGLPFVLLLIIRPIWLFWRQSSRNNLGAQPAASAWCAALLGIFVYGIAYGISPDLYALLAIGNAINVRHSVEIATLVENECKDEVDYATTRLLAKRH